MGKIGDLFVRLGLKSEGFKEGMKDAKKETQGFSGALGKMKSGALAVWAAIGAAVAKFAKDFVEATNTMTDKWEFTMSSVKASYHSVLADMSNYKPDFSSVRAFFKNEWAWIKNTFGNAKEAGKAGREAAEAFAEEFELVNSVKLQRQAAQQELNELYTQMRDTTLSPTARQAAADKYKALLQPIADAEVAIYGNMLNKAVEAWQAGNQLDRVYSTAELTEFFMKIGTEYDKMAAKFPDLIRVYNTRKGDAQNQGIFDIISKYQQASNQMSDVGRVLSRTTNSIKAETVRELEAIDKEVRKWGGEDIVVEKNVDLVVDIEDGLDFSYLDNEIAAFINDFTKEAEEIKALNEMLEQSFVQAFSGGAQAVTDMLFGIEGADAKQVLAALMQPFAQTATQLGEMLIAQGLGIEAFKKSLQSLQPGVALAAGAALVALGAAMSSGIKALGSGGASGGTSASTSVGTSVQTIEQDITVHVVGEISGDKIILAGQKTLNKWNR